MNNCGCTQMTLVITVSVVVFICGTASSCFIRNCPMGGKRSMDIVSRGTVPCLTCGPGNTGQCVGPNICCGAFGCYIGTSESRSCEKENESTEPCSIRGDPCGARGQGSCVADGVCCDSGACSLNPKCQSTGRGGVQLLSLLNKILEEEELK